MDLWTATEERNHLFMDLWTATEERSRLFMDLWTATEERNHLFMDLWTATKGDTPGFFIKKRTAVGYEVVRAERRFKSQDCISN